MRLLLKLSKDALRYKAYYITAIISTLALTLINLTAPKLLSSMTAVVEAGVGRDGLNEIGRLTIFLSALYLLRVLFRFLSNYLAHKAAWHLVEDLRVRVYAKIQGLSMSFFHDKQTGDLMSRVVNDTATFELLYAHMIPEFITNIITVIGVIIILLGINVKLALLCLIPVPFILLGGWIFSAKIRPTFRRAQKAIAGINSKIQDNFSGIAEIQSFGREDDENLAVREKVNHHTRALLHSLFLSGAFHPVVELMSAIGTVIVVGVGGLVAYQTAGTGIAVSDIVAFLLYLSLFYTPISGLARLLEETQQAFAGAERVVAVLNEVEVISDSPNAVDLGKAEGLIEFQNVSFRYNDDSPVLKNISFTAKPGQMIALVGPTGVGKTTMTQLIPRFYDPTEGCIKIDGHDLRNLSVSSLRANIAPVLQDTYLFNGTIADNIAYSRPGATDEEIISAAKAAHIHNSIVEMPNGYATEVGERGLRLSGGQKQRVAIARAILRGSPVIILDEATASVDTQTEREIQAAIASLAENHTIVAIAHRLSTIASADLILVLEEGEVVQRGTHEELINAGGLYSKLYNAQL